jgi:hypothetical protein
MLGRETLFIIGAGAGFDIEMPKRNLGKVAKRTKAKK